MPDISLTDLTHATGSKRAEATLEAYSLDLPTFILDTGFFITKDEHATGPDKPLPDKPYIRTLLRELTTHQFVVLVKSRQILATWTILAYLLARALTRPNQLIIVQTKREDDARNLIGRCYHYYDRLPQWIRAVRPRVHKPLASDYKLELPANKSLIWGIPQGADIIRSNTVSVFFSDECDYQPDALASVRAAVPSLIGGGQGIWVSTPTLDGLLKHLIEGKWSDASAA